MSYAMEQGPRPHLITVDEYHRMAEVGLLAPDGRVELIEGVIIDMAPIGSPHGMTVDMLNEILVPLVKGRAIVRTQGAVKLSQWSEPQPDLVLLKPRSDRYRSSNPNGDDVQLVIEVSESSLRFDFDTKSRLYARYGVPELWIVDLNDNAIHFMRGRTDLGFCDVSSTLEPGLVSLPGFDLVIDLAALFDVDARPS
jgi:Uma2 family endonuclease